MLKKTVTYEDPFTGSTVVEDLYFNFTKAEIVEMELAVEGEGGLKEHLEKIAASENGQQIMSEMKAIILKAYGQRDGTKFIKNDRIREEFESSEAYSTLFMEMVTETDSAIEFVNGIMPKGLEEMGQEQLDVSVDAPDRPNLTAVEEKTAPRRINQEEARVMPAEELRSGLAEGRYILV